MGSRVRKGFTAAIGLMAAFAFATSAVAAEDTTPPVGKLVIDGGIGHLRRMA